MTENAVSSYAEVVVDLNERKPIKVLHVDDEPTLLKIAKQYLEMQGPFQVDTASSVEEALEKLKKETYDAVISDYKMPSKDGLELLKELRQGGNNIPFVMFTGKGREEVAIKALNFGADRYINKTGDPETVYCELEHALRRTVEQEKTETALGTLGEKYRRLCESAIDGILINGSDGKILSANPAAVSILGYSSPKDLIGKPAVELYANPEVRALLLQELMEKGYVKERKLTWKKRDGTLIEILASITVQKDEKGKMLRTEGIIRDVTEGKKTEEELRRFSVAVKTSLDGILTGDLNGIITDVNDAALRMYGGSSKKDMIGKNVLDFLVEGDRTRALQDSMESMKTGQGKTIGYRARTKNGTEIPIEITTAFIRDEQGEPIGFVDIVRNIAEREKAALELQVSEKKYRELTDQLPLIVYEIDNTGRFTFINEKGLEITGYSREDFEKGLNILKMVADEDRDKAEIRIHRTLSGEKIDYNEYTVIGKGGGTFPAIIRGTAVVSEGKIVGLRGIGIDITERKKAEEPLRESEEKFRNLAEESPNMIFINQNGKVVYANKNAEDAMGYKKEEFYSPDFNFLDLIAQGYKETVKSAFSKHAKGEDISPYDYKLITKEGKMIDAIINSRLIKYDGKPATLGVVTDITERKKAERVTLESQQKFKALFMGNPEAAAHVGPDFRILDINPRFEELFGYSLAEIRGKHIDDVVVQDGKEEEAKMLDKKTLQGFVYHSTMRKRKDGSLVPVAVSAASITVEGSLSGYVAMYKDISELKDAEKKLETMNEKLRVVGGLTRHDVRNKLSTITGNAYLLKKQFAGNSKILDILRDMETAVQQTVEIFDFAKAYEMLGIEELEYIDIETTINEAASFFADLHDVEITNKCHGLTVLADSLLRQLFYNLMDNSLKHGQKTTKIRVRFEKTSQDELKLFYEDNGVGIRDNEKPNIFKEGYTTGKGSGYGLYLVRKMVEAYGWIIEETSETDKGAQFTITIPTIDQNGKENYRIT